MPRVDVRGTWLHYRASGGGETLLLVHGLGSSARDWELQTSAVASHYRVIAVDLRGHGQSQKPAGPYSMTHFAADMDGLLQVIDAGPAHVVGISLGGMVALQLALDTPEMVRSLCVVNSVPEVSVRTLRQHSEMALRMVITRVLRMRAMAAFIAATVFPEPENAQLRRAMAALWSQNDRRAYAAASRALPGWSVLNRLKEISCRALVVSGDRPYSSLLQCEPRLAEIPGAQVVIIPGALHAAPVQQPEQFNAALRAFLSAQTVTPADESVD
jgi:pimeloyl-ACP methyl ester carboxylesterase